MLPANCSVPSPRHNFDSSRNNHGKETSKEETTKSSRYERQQRYREKKRRYAGHLESTVLRLRMDVDQQLLARCNAQTNLSHNDKQFAAASQLRNLDAADIATVMRGCMQAFESGVQNQQESYLESMMRSDVHYGELVGRGGVLQHWTQFTATFAPVLENCEVSVDFCEQETAMGHARATLIVHLTHSSVGTIFPYALADTRVRDKLFKNSTVRLPMSVFFQFDEQGKVQRYEPTIDFVTGLYEMLGDFCDVANTLNLAKINAYGQICEELLPAANNLAHAVDLYGYRGVESDCASRCTPVHFNKFSVDFLLSNGEDVRRAETDN